MTSTVVAAMQSVGDVRVIDLSHRSNSGWRWKFVKGAKVVMALPRLLAKSRSNPNWLYICANSGAGLYYDVLIVAVARLLRYQCVVHHHVYSYISQRDWRMGLVDRMIGSNGIHVVHCNDMVRDFRSVYPSISRFVCVPGSIVSLESISELAELHSPFRIGHMSNLTVAKGLDVVIDTFKLLRNEGIDVELVLAGPAETNIEERLIEKVCSMHPDAVEYRGPVFGQSKIEFFSDIDCFLFPSRYKNESWGIVLSEAMAAGVPVIAFGRASIPYVVGNSGGLVVDPKKSFCVEAVGCVKHWINHPDDYRRASRRSRQRSEELECEGRIRLQSLITQLLSAEPGDLAAGLAGNEK